VDSALRDLSRHLNAPDTSRNVRLVGYSFGGLLAALLAERYFERIAKLLLFAPAIDNIARNYSGDPAQWQMPRDYVEELRKYPARPAIVCPTTLVYGDLDDDSGGSTPNRYRAWASEQPFAAVHELAGVDHDLEPWLTQGEPKPALAELVAALVA
jgi:pimeloyl-ACP methyl ester carboxylesterase